MPRPRPNAGACGDAGPRRRMEDAHAVCGDLWEALQSPGDPEAPAPPSAAAPHCAFYGVYDGHGGARTAALAATHLHRLLAQRLHRLPLAGLAGGGAVRRCLRDAYADAEALAEAQDLADGTTAATALVVGHAVFVANLGDSRVVVCGPGGAVRFATQDHRPDLPSERARIAAAGVAVDDAGPVPRVGALSVSRALGDFEYKTVAPGRPGPPISAEPDVTEYPLTDADRFMVLASDGLWDVHSSAAVGALVWGWLQEGKSVGEAAELLVASAVTDLRQRDNVTAVVVTV